MKNTIKSTLFVLCTVGVSLFSSVQASVWTGAAGDGKWETVGNWDDGVLPTEFAEINKDDQVSISSDVTLGSLFFKKGRVTFGEGGSLSASFVNIWSVSHFSLNGGSLILNGSKGYLTLGIDSVNGRTLDLGGGTIDVSTETGESMLHINGTLRGRYSDQEEGLEKVTEYLMINGNQENLEDYVKSLSGVVGYLGAALRLEDLTALTRYTGEDVNSMGKSEYYIYAENGNLAISYWRQKENWTPTPSGELVPEPSTASLSLLALSALLLRRRRAQAKISVNMKSTIKSTLFALCTVGVSLFSSVQASVWTGAAGDGKWETVGNWDDGVLPTEFAEINKDDQVSISSNVTVDYLQVPKGAVICGKGFSLSAIEFIIGRGSNFYLNGGTLILREGGFLSLGLDLVNQETMDLGGGTIDVSTATGGTTLSISRSLRGFSSGLNDEGNLALPAEMVTEYLMINGDQKNLEDYVASLTVVSGGFDERLSLQDGAWLTRYEGEDVSSLHWSQYYIHAEDGNLAISYWRRKETLSPNPSGELVPEPSTASLSLLALSALLLRRRRA